MAPDYYQQFHCIAEKCRHSCCIGWEIDVDETSVERYRRIPGQMGREIRENIAMEDGTAHYILTEDERCPFLREDGLCRMILELGEGALCQICADHPRFRNYFMNRTEIGLGLCCEAAGALILKKREPMKLICLNDDGISEGEDQEEETLLSFRDMLLEILQDRSLSLNERLKELQQTCGCCSEQPMQLWGRRLLTLERLDEQWTECLKHLCDMTEENPELMQTEEWELAFEQAAVYFLYRYLPSALADGDVASKVAFAVLGVRVLKGLCSIQLNHAGQVSCDDLVEYARMYSGEIEYSEDNLQQVFDWLYNDC